MNIFFLFFFLLKKGLFEIRVAVGGLQSLKTFIFLTDKARLG